MRKEQSLQFWAKEQFLLLTGEDALWNEAEELVRRKRLTEFSTASGRVLGRFSVEQQSVRAELLAPLFSDELWQQFLKEQQRSLRLYAHLLAGQLAWDEESLSAWLTPAAFIPKDGGVWNEFTAALLIEFYDRISASPFLFFEVRGKTQQQLMEALSANYQSSADSTGVAINLNEIDLSEWNSFTSPNLTYSLRADELPALLFKRIESIPLPGDTENVEQLLSELYVHLAKRAQAYGLTFRR